MKIEDVRFGSIITDRIDGITYKIIGGYMDKDEQVIEVKRVCDEELLCLDYVLKNCDVTKEYDIGMQIF